MRNCAVAGRDAFDITLTDRGLILKPVSPLNRAKSGKIGHFQTFEFEPLYQPYFGFWLFAWSRCGRIVKKSSRKDSC